METFRKWIKTRKAISILAIEKEVGVAEGTINKYVNGSRNIPEKHKVAIGLILKRYGFDGNFD